MSWLRATRASKKVRAHSRSAASMERFSQECATRWNLAVTPAPDLEAALADTDICVTCTPAKGAFVKKGWVRPGTFVAAIGAESPDKQELDPALLQGHKVVADILDQCLHVGEIHHGVAGGFLTAEDVHAELGQVIAGQRPGRTSPEEITIFDSTGTALQDLAAAMVVYRKVSTGAVYPTFDFFAS